MAGYRIYMVLAGLVLAVSGVSAQNVDFAQLLQRIYPDAERFSRVSELSAYASKKLTDAVFTAYKGEVRLGTVFYASPAGYNGKIHVLSALDTDGTVQKVNVFRHSETPAYVQGLTNGSFVRQFEGVGLKDRLSLLIGSIARNKGEIAAMTGATDTSKPIAIAVGEARKLFVELYGM